MFSRRFARKLFEYAIELREGLKSSGECDFTNAQPGVSQEITGGREASTRDVLDKIDTSHLLEVFAQIIRVYADCLRYLFQGELSIRVFCDKLARFPDRDRLGSVTSGSVFTFRSREHLDHPPDN